MTRKDQIKIASQLDDLDALKKEIACKLLRYGKKEIAKRGTWGYFLKRFFDWLETDGMGLPPFSVFGLKGNKKLKFATFSSTALADCPGKGACAKFCYSLKGWRYPAAFLRQLQNSVLQRHYFDTIAYHFQALPENLTLRLFVDGDFYSFENLKNWMDILHTRPDLQVYGYSKSWMEFVSLNASGYKWPENYVVNASSGSRWENTGIANAFKKLPVVRGEFVATQVSKSHMDSGAYQGKDKPGNLEYRKEVREKLTAKRAFACPGTCFDCMAGGKHACGSKEMAGVTIGIGIH